MMDDEWRLFVQGRLSERRVFDESMRAELIKRVRDRHSNKDSNAKELYAMPSAMPSFLDDSAVDVKQWLVDETAPAFAEYLGTRDVSCIGEIEVLRDPFSTKPYVLFYVTANVVPPTMTNDLIERLNALAIDCENTDGWEEATPTCDEAAQALKDKDAEIERLKEALDRATLRENNAMAINTRSPSRNDVLEEAAKVAEIFHPNGFSIAHAIRALKDRDR